MKDLFIEESLPNGSYQTVWDGKHLADALDTLRNFVSENRLELWSIARADSAKGFAPLAFRIAKSKHVSISNTLQMFRQKLGAPIGVIEPTWAECPSCLMDTRDCTCKM